ncbi:RHS repeat-associated core domain-containing protein [Rhizocola hellebori]|uniref:RHS repeat-associated core domain-containing protein n=1 Tax=Rhizocola hellebori TaxID=1392758 RepID=UPI001943FB33|nr:RHS repeat-associated core domain-containing protein [Rhizocola hellebori]
MSLRPPASPIRKPLAMLLAMTVGVFNVAFPIARAGAVPGAEPIRYSYDDASRLVGVTDPTGDTASYAYDAAGNLTGINRYPSSRVSVLSLTPSRGSVGAEVIVSGTGFSATASANAVTFAGAPAAVVSASATQLVVTVPAGTTTGTVAVVTSAGSASSTQPFTLEVAANAPTVAGFSPVSGGEGTVITISGTGFDPDPARNTVLFNQAARGKVTAATSTSLTVEVPKVGAGKIAVRTSAGVAVSAEDFSVAPGTYAQADVVSTTRVAVDGATATSTVGTAGKVAVLRFDGVAGQRLSLAFTGKTIAGAVTVRLYQPVGIEFSGNEFSGSYSFVNSTSISLPPLEATGTYQVVLDPNDSAATGSVVATLSKDLDAGTLDRIGPSTAVAISRVGQRARMVLDGTVGQRYTVALSGNTVASGTMVLSVFWPDGEALLSTVSFSGNRTLALDPLPQTGRFQVVVDSGITPRSFTVSLSTPTDLGSISLTGPGVAISSARPGQSALLRFDGTAGQLLAVGLTASTYSSSLSVTVRKPDGEPLTVIPMAFSATLLVPQLPLTGTYEMFFSPASGSTGGATITLSSELDGGTLTTTGASSVITVARPGQNMRLRFDGTAGQRLSLGFTGTWFTGSSAINVFQADGTALVPVEFLSGENSLNLPILPVTAAYEVVISPVAARTGTATVTLSADLDAGVPTTTGAGVGVTITRPGQNARLRFDGTAGQRLSLGFTASTLSSYRVSVYRPDGTSLMSSTSISGVAADVDVPILLVSGTYEVLIDPSAARTGSVTATLSSEVDAGIVDAVGAGTAVTVVRPGQDARVAFAGTAGQRLSLAGTNLSFGGSYSVSVLRPDGTVLVTPKVLSGTAPELDLPVLAVTGTYQVLIDPELAKTGSVTITLSSDVDAGVVTIGGAGIVATLARPGQNARLRFGGTAGQSLTVALSATTFSGLVGLSVLKPDGTVLTTRNMAGTATLALSALPSTGTYEILVDPIAGQTGSTTVALRFTAAANANAAVATIEDQPDAGAMSDHDEWLAMRAMRMKSPGFGVSVQDEWIPGAVNLAGKDWRSRLPSPEYAHAAAQRTPQGVTALAGHVQTLAGRPLSGVSVSIDDTRGTTDADGRFRLTGLSAGHHELLVEGGEYGIYEIGVDVAAGRTTVLPYPIWLTRIDTRNKVQFPSPTTSEVVITTPRIPGLEVHLPAGSVVEDSRGRVVTELGITAIPVDRPPFPLPEHIIVPIYFTVQPGGSYVFPKGARIVYPNYTHLDPGTRVEFWSYDPQERGWHVYGHGSVTANGQQVVPDPGVRVYEFTGAMINQPGTPLTGPSTGPQQDFLDWLSGDPVDLGTGLFIDTHTDLFLPDVMPISLSRTYRQADGTVRAFGLGQNFNYGIFLHSKQEYEEVDLVLPDGGKVHYDRISPGTGFGDAVFLNTKTPNEWYHSTISWNGNGWNLSRRDGMTYVFGDTTPLQAIRDRHGNQITITRTGVNGNPSAGAITRITSPNGKWIKLTGGGLVSRAEDSLGRVVEYRYDSRLRLTSVTDPAGKVTTYGWNEANQVATITDPRGITYLTNQYDGNGRVQRQTLPGNAVTEFVYTLNGDKVVSTRATDPNGHVRRVIFNADGFATNDTYAVDTDKEQTKTLVRQPGTNLVTRSIDSLGRETAYAHDGFGNTTSVTAFDGTAHPATTTTVYGGPFNQITETTDPLSHTTRYTYDTEGNLATLTDPEGRTVTFTHTPTGEVATTTDQLGKTTTFHYQLGDLVATTDPLGRTTHMFTDAAGRVLESRNPIGGVSRLTYDQRNQPTTVTDPLGLTTTFTYDENGNMLSRTANGHTATWTYDHNDQMQTSTDPLGRIARYGYDAAGRLTTLTARSGKVTTFDYDELDRITTTRYGVVGAGSESSVTNSYDPGNRLTGIVDSQAGAIVLTPDDRDRVIQETTAQGTITYGFDDAGRRTSMQIAGQPAVTYGYNNADQPISITKGGQTVGYAYDAAGRPSTLSLPTGVSQTYGYDDAGQLTSITYKRGSSTLGEITYGYDRLGRRTTAGGSYARTAIPNAFTGSVYNAADQLTNLGAVSYTYDADGNLTSDGSTTYTWNARGQLTGLTRPGTSAAFGYDAVGRRIAKTVNATTVGYLHDGDTPVQELNGTTPTANLLTGGTDAFYARTDDAGTTTSYLTDALGSTVGLAGQAGPPATEYTYEPFGAAETSGAADDNTFQYTGRENDGTGLSYHRARYYHPGLQRFISQDPIGYAGGSNLYAYADNNPTNLVDPNGTFAFLAALVPIAATFISGALIGGGMSFGMQRLSGRKVDWSQVGFDAFIGGALNVITAGMGAELALLDDIARIPRPCNSFTPDTPVLMADGTTKPIADIEQGEEVLATDPQTGESGARPVTALIEGKGEKKLVDIQIQGDTITATTEHPFWDAGKGTWVNAEDLEAGDLLRTVSGEQVVVQEVGKRSATVRANNLTVEDLHTYYVVGGDAPVLVHNCNDIRVSPMASDWATKGAHVHVGANEVRVFPTGAGGVGAEPVRLRTGSATETQVQHVLDCVASCAALREDITAKAGAAMVEMNSHNWGNSLNRASEMNFLIKALAKIK